MSAGNREDPETCSGGRVHQMHGLVNLFLTQFDDFAPAECLLVTGLGFVLLYVTVHYLKTRSRAEEPSTDLAAGDGDYRSRSSAEGGVPSDKSDLQTRVLSSTPNTTTVDESSLDGPSDPPSDVQRFLCKFTSAYGVQDIVRSLNAQCLPLSENCFKLTVEDGDEGIRWLWLIPVGSPAKAAAVLRDIELVEQTNAFAKTGSDNYCTTFRTSEWMWFIKEKGAQQGDGAGGRNLVVLLEPHFVEYPIDLDNLATLGVDRLTAILRQINLAFEVYRRSELRPAVESLRWKLTLGVHDDDLVEFWFNQELHIAQGQGVQVRLTPTNLFGNGGVELSDFLEAAITHVPALRCNPDLTSLTRVISAGSTA